MTQVKKSIPYFPHDTNSSNDPKIILLINRKGLIGKAVFFDICEKIYGNEGYFIYMENPDDDPNKFIKELFCANRGLEENDFDIMLSECINVKLFDKKIFEEYQILTSRRIQENYFNAIKSCRRKRCIIIEEILMFDPQEIKGFDIDLIFTKLNDVVSGGSVDIDKVKNNVIKGRSNDVPQNAVPKYLNGLKFNFLFRDLFVYCGCECWVK